MRRSSTPGCFFACAINGLLCFSGHGLAGFFRFLAYGLGSLFCFLANRFSSLLCFISCCFPSVFNRLPCFLRAVLYVLNHALLAERGQGTRRNQSSNQTRNFHVPFLRLITSYYWIESGGVIARTSNARSLNWLCPLLELLG